MILAALTLGACATTGKYEEKLNQLIGADELTLVRTLGPPSSGYPVGNSMFLVFGGEQGSVILPAGPSTATTSVYGNTAYTKVTPGMPAMAIRLSCITTFELQNDRVVSWRWQGNHCKAR